MVGHLAMEDTKLWREEVTFTIAHNLLRVELSLEQFRIKRNQLM